MKHHGTEKRMLDKNWQAFSSHRVKVKDVGYSGRGGGDGSDGECKATADRKKQ